MLIVLKFCVEILIVLFEKLIIVKDVFIFLIFSKDFESWVINVWLLKMFLVFIIVNLFKKIFILLSNLFCLIILFKLFWSYVLIIIVFVL